MPFSSVESSLHAGIDFKKKTIVLEGKRIKLYTNLVRQLVNLSTWQYNVLFSLPLSSLSPCRDTAGQEKFHTITPKLYCGANVSQQVACGFRVVIRSRNIRGCGICQLTTVLCEYTHDRVLF